MCAAIAPHVRRSFERVVLLVFFAMRSSCRLWAGVGSQGRHRSTLSCGVDQDKRDHGTNRTTVCRSHLAVGRENVQTASVLTRTRLYLLAPALAACGTALLAQTSPAPAMLKVSHSARAVAPGEVVLVDVRAGSPLRDVQAQWMSGTVAFYAVTASHWQGLAPIDVAATAGRQTLALRATAADGRRTEQSYPITIAARTFPARRITVEQKFVDPPAGQLARIEAEREKVEKIFGHPTAERYWKGPFVVPVPGQSTSSFGRRSIVNGQPRGQHTGTDFQAATGTPVVAPNRGRIALAADLYFPGRTIIIDHGLGLYSYLAHLSEFSVEEGAMVERGQRVGLSGATGRVTGPHLHWTMRIGSARVDPLSLMVAVNKEVGGRR
jgi:murein DD-endopeptidase MepM/ murein hydrolase activator NlpD